MNGNRSEVNLLLTDCMREKKHRYLMSAGVSTRRESCLTEGGAGVRKLIQYIKTLQIDKHRGTNASARQDGETGTGKNIHTKRFEHGGYDRWGVEGGGLRERCGLSG